MSEQKGYEQVYFVAAGDAWRSTTERLATVFNWVYGVFWPDDKTIIEWKREAWTRVRASM